MKARMTDRLGVVAIGRNEGPRLKRCLRSVKACGLPAVYVDSGSTDDSIAIAEALGTIIVRLDPSTGFTASRARHAGCAKLLESFPDTKLVQFVDGDCELQPGWPAAACGFMHATPQAAVVAGRRRERCPERSVYNRLCDTEWNTPCGRAIAVGGDFVVRVDAYHQVGGFDRSVPAGEEPELCARLRQSGWEVWRIDKEMTLHDADITRISQWWKRQVRTGYGGYDVERRFRIGMFDNLLRGAVVWVLGLPLLTIALAVSLFHWLGPSWALSTILALVSLYLIQVLRIARGVRPAAGSWRNSLEYGWFTMLAKTPILVGACRAAWCGVARRPTRIVEYKQASQG